MDTGLYNNYGLDIIVHKSLRLHLSWDSFIVYHYHDRINTNIFFCNVFLNASAKGTCKFKKKVNLPGLSVLHILPGRPVDWSS